jgi:hypothetical protein
MPSPGDDVMNQAIRSRARPTPPDLSDPVAVNAAIRQAAGRPPPEAPTLDAPPPPEAAPADVNRWAERAIEAGMDGGEVARWVGSWHLAHRQHLADRRGQR